MHFYEALLSRKVKIFLNVLLYLTFIFYTNTCVGQEKAEHKPLFSIKLNHSFSDPEKSFNEIKSLILKHYYSDEISEEALYYAAVKGMLRFISPPDNQELGKIWTPEEYEIILRSLKGIRLSLGIKSTFNRQDGSLTVTDIIAGSPADGILSPYDRILRIDSMPLKDKSIEEIDELLMGKEGSEVLLTVNRDIKIFDIRLKRHEFEAKNLIVSQLTKTIALVELKRLTENISQKLAEELNNLKTLGFEAIIMDLRNNTGGVLMESLRVVELFLPDKSIILRTLQRETGLQNYISSNKEVNDFKTVILINGNTASSAEIIASALQDHGKAIIVGSRTFGKGVFEKTFTLENDYRIKFITGAMYSPKGKNWQGRGIAPDFLVNQDDATLEALYKLEPVKRFEKDVAMITAFKLLTP